jgi:hypothetical protein
LAWANSPQERGRWRGDIDLVDDAGIANDKNEP